MHNAASGHHRGSCAGGGKRPCRAFPGEVEDFYCLACHVPCSALSLLVGEHTNHPRRRLDDAYETAPTDIAREASEFQHCVDVFCATVAHRMHQQQQLESELQQQLVATKEAVARLLQEQAYLERHMEACDVAFEEDSMVDRGRMQALRRAGLNLRRATEEWKRMYEADHGIHPVAYQNTCQELDDVRRRLTQTLKSLDGSLAYAATNNSSKMAPVGNANDVHTWTTPPPQPATYDTTKRSSNGQEGVGASGVHGFGGTTAATLVGVRRSAQDRAALYESHQGQQCATADSGDRYHPLAGEDAAIRPATASAATLLGDLEAMLLAQRCCAERRDSTTSPLNSRASVESEHLVDDVPLATAASHRIRKKKSNETTTHNDRRRRAPSSSSSSMSNDDEGPPGAGLRSHAAAASPSVHRRATLLRQYYHLRSCLQDAIDTNQPASLVRMFVRGIRQLREEARLAGCENDIERAVAGDASASAEYALIFENS